MEIGAFLNILEHSTTLVNNGRQCWTDVHTVWFLLANIPGQKSTNVVQQMSYRVDGALIDNHLFCSPDTSNCWGQGTSHRLNLSVIFYVTSGEYIVKSFIPICWLHITSTDYVQSDKKYGLNRTHHYIRHCRTLFLFYCPRLPFFFLLPGFWRTNKRRVRHTQSNLITTLHYNQWISWFPTFRT